MIAIPIQLLHFAYVVEPYLTKHGNPAPEFWLRVALGINFLAPAGLFIFGKYLHFRLTCCRGTQIVLTPFLRSMDIYQACDAFCVDIRQNWHPLACLSKYLVGCWYIGEYRLYPVCQLW